MPRSCLVQGIDPAIFVKCPALVIMLPSLECGVCSLNPACPVHGLPSVGNGGRENAPPVKAGVDVDALRQEVSRHRAQWKRPDTQPGFWDMGFMDSLDSRVQLQPGRPQQGAGSKGQGVAGGEQGAGKVIDTLDF